jgi:hypothetical protein
MNIDKINVWILGLCLFFAGGTLIYLESYKNNEIIGGVSYLLMFAGWLCLFMKAIKDTIVDAPKILFKVDKPGFFKQRIISFFAYVISIGAMLGSMFWLNDMGQKRRADVLQNQPTNTTIAIVDHIDVRHGRNSTSYYAVFSYTVNGKTITYPWYEQRESNFLVGERFEIKYSVTHPDMFMLLDKLQ